MAMPATMARAQHCALHRDAYLAAMTIVDSKKECPSCGAEMRELKIPSNRTEPARHAGERGTMFTAELPGRRCEKCSVDCIEPQANKAFNTLMAEVLKAAPRPASNRSGSRRMLDLHPFSGEEISAAMAAL